MKDVKVLGTGCPKCEKLALQVEKVARENNIDIHLEKVTDMNAILNYGIMMTPGLIIDGEVKMSGKLPGSEEIKALLI